jgi:hypothetical protein
MPWSAPEDRKLLRLFKRYKEKHKMSKHDALYRVAGELGRTIDGIIARLHRYKPVPSSKSKRDKQLEANHE